MICVPLMGCASSNLASRASAGGQLEQPSEVNSSTITGMRAPVRIPAVSCAHGWKRAIATKKEQQTSTSAAKPYFMEANSSNNKHLILTPARSYRK
jgi:hypothetical protein